MKLRDFLHKHAVLIAILLVAAFLRLWQLGTNPPSIDWDEASLGYNAYSILKTGSDEFGNHLPLSIRSFNDYKPPAYTYLTIPFVATLGLTEVAVRLPSALMGILAVFLTYLLAGQIFSYHKHRWQIGLVAAFLLAVSPWHLQFSRAAFEANVALTFYIAAITFFLYTINSKKSSTLYTLASTLSIITAISTAAALYAYHSARLVVPLTFLGLLFVFRKKIIKRKPQAFLAAGLLLIFMAPLIYISFRGSVSERFNTVSIFTNPGEFSRETERITRSQKFRLEHTGPLRYLHHPYTVYTKIVARNYFEHFNFDFLFLQGDGNGRHSTVGMGLLYLFELPLLLAGLYYLSKNHHQNHWVIWLILLVGPLPASLTADTPHTIRSFLTLPAWQLISAFGAYYFYQKINKHRFKNLLLVTCGLLLLANIFTYLNLYHVVYPVTNSRDWQYGYKQAVHKVSELEADYDEVIFTTEYDQPYIYFAFYNSVEPTRFQTFAESAPKGFDKYIFRPIEYRTDSQVPNALIVADPDNSPNDIEPIHQIKFLDGSTAFNFYSTK